MHLNAMYLEPNLEPDEELVAGVASAMRDFLAWHKATGLVIARSDPVAFGTRLESAL